MPVYKLSYFNSMGRAEVARLLFAAAGKEFEDERLAGEQWMAFKPKTPYGQMPVLTVDKTMINQSGAIFRYLAREFNLYGKNNMESTKCDIVYETMNDVFAEMVKIFFEKDEAKKAELGKNLNENVLPKYFTYLAKTLKDNGGKFLVGSQLSFADIATFDLIDKFTNNPNMGEAIYKDFPEVKTFYQAIKATPNIQRYLEKRPKTDN